MPALPRLAHCGNKRHRPGDAPRTQVTFGQYAAALLGYDAASLRSRQGVHRHASVGQNPVSCAASLA